MLHPHLSRAQSGAVGMIAALRRTEVGMLALTADWVFVVGSAAEDKRC